MQHNWENSFVPPNTEHLWVGLMEKLSESHFWRKCSYQKSGKWNRFSVFLSFNQNNLMNCYFIYFLEKQQGQRSGKQNQTIDFQRLGQGAIAARKRGPNTVVKLLISCDVLGFGDRIWILLYSQQPATYKRSSHISDGDVTFGLE